MAFSMSCRCRPSSSVSPITFSVATTTRVATSSRADCSARSRSASISLRAVSPIRRASSSAFCRRSWRTCSPDLLAASTSCEAVFGVGARLLGVLKLLRDRSLAPLGDLDDLRVHPPGQDGEHEQERQQLDDHRPVDIDDAGGAFGRQEDHRDYLAGTLARNTNPKARLMKYIASTRPTIVNSQGIIRP